MISNKLHQCQTLRKVMKSFHLFQNNFAWYFERKLHDLLQN